jgi:hypothetical protein
MWCLPCRICTSVTPVAGRGTIAVALRLADISLRWSAACGKSAVCLVARDAKAISRLTVREEANRLVSRSDKMEYQNVDDRKQHYHYRGRDAAPLGSGMLNLRDPNEWHIRRTNRNSITPAHRPHC